MQFCRKCGIQDFLLKKFTTTERISMLSAFAGAIRRNEFGTRNKKCLAGCTVQATLGNVCASFRTHLRPDPSLDDSGARAMILTRQIQGYITDDPAPKHERCLPLSVYRRIHSTDVCLLTEALGQLIIISLFFGMRSCEYTTTSGTRKTKLIQLEDIRFFIKNREISKTNHFHIASPDKVTVTFVR